MKIKKLIAELKKLDEENPNANVFVLIKDVPKDFTIVPNRDSDCFPYSIFLAPN